MFEMDVQTFCYNYRVVTEPMRSCTVKENRIGSAVRSFGTHAGRQRSFYFIIRIPLF